jgi:hypothetical protein
MRKIWAVAEGAYSDWSVIAVFEREEDAEKARAEGMGEEVVDFPYFPAGEPPATLTIFVATGVEGTMDIEVKTETYREGEFHVHAGDDSKPPARPRVNRIQPWSLEGKYAIRAICGDREAAVKAVKDRLAAALAGV